MTPDEILDQAKSVLTNHYGDLSLSSIDSQFPDRFEHELLETLVRLAYEDDNSLHPIKERTEPLYPPYSDSVMRQVLDAYRNANLSEHRWIPVKYESPICSRVANQMVIDGPTIARCAAAFDPLALSYVADQDFNHLMDNIHNKNGLDDQNKISAIESLMLFVEQQKQDRVHIELISNPYFKQQSKKLQVTINEKYEFKNYDPKTNVDLFLTAAAYLKAFQIGVSVVSVAYTTLALAYEESTHTSKLSDSLKNTPAAPANKISKTSTIISSSRADSVTTQAAIKNNKTAFNEHSVRIKQVRQTNTVVVLTASSVLHELAAFRESIVSNNHLIAEHEEFHASLMEFIDELDKIISELIDAVPVDINAKPIDEVPEAKRYRDEYIDHCKENIKSISSAKAMADVSVPAGFILASASLGAAIGATGGSIFGPIGAGAGALGGATFGTRAMTFALGRYKPEQVADKTLEALDGSDDPK